MCLFGNENVLNSVPFRVDIFDFEIFSIYRKLEISFFS